jgi:hypothetical protein
MNTVSNSSTPSQPATSTADTTVGKDTSNNDPTHEAGESATVEAAETAGKGHGEGGPGGDHHGHSNTDPTHEASESPARVAQEAADDAANATSTTNAG